MATIIKNTCSNPFEYGAESTMQKKAVAVRPKVALSVYSEK